MLYAIMSNDVENSLALRQKARPAHLDRLNTLQDEGRLVIAGPLPISDSEEPSQAGFSGSLIVAEFESLEQAKLWADNDPYVEAGVYENVSVRPFKKVFPQ